MRSSFFIEIDVPIKIQLLFVLWSMGDIVMGSVIERNQFIGEMFILSSVGAQVERFTIALDHLFRPLCFC